MLNLTRLSSSCPAASSTPGLTRRFLASHPHHTATNGATASFKHVGIPHATIPKTGVAVSRIGFGGYRINNSTAEHKLALLEAVKSGVNVIDTSAHFENGASEELIGEALKDLFVNNFIKREQLVLISKAGYLQRSDTKDFVASDYVQINDKHFHSLSPAVLDAHITRSLRRMGIDQLDVFMLNSPERMLLAKNKPFTKSDVYASISLAIRHLDTEVAQGRIGGYGICSNSMSNPLAPDHISLATILDDLGHGRADNFVAVQAPFNLFERGVVGGDVYEDGVAAAGDPLAKIAAERGLYLLTNRPLNAVTGGRVRTLTNAMVESANSENELQSKMTLALEGTVSLETDISAMLPIHRQTLATKFVWGKVLAENFSSLSQDPFAMKYYLHHEVEPAIRRDLEALGEYTQSLQDEDERKEYVAWMARYDEQTRSLLSSLVSYTRLNLLRENTELDRVLSAVFPKLSRLPSGVSAHSPLTVKALRVLLAHREVGTVLVGMRTRVYVSDAVMAARASEEEPMEADGWKSFFI